MPSHRAKLGRIILLGLIDNFEWAFGYAPRFGIFWVDFETQERIIKDSGHWFTEVIQSNALN